MKKMQNGGVTRPIPKQKKPVTREYKIREMNRRRIVKSPLKNGTGLILKDKSKLQEGVYKPTMQTGGGFPITAKAAARKVGKGKGMMTYNYGTSDAPGSGDNKGAYVKFAKKQTPNPYGGKTLQGRSRRVMQKGGGIKKMQNGGITKDGQKIKFPPIVKKEVIQKSAPTRQTAFEKRQNKKIERAKTRSAIANIEGEGTVKDKRNNRANRIATAVGTGRQKVSRTSSTSTTSNTNSGNTNVSSGSDSGSTSGSRSTSGSSSGSTSGVSGSGNSQNANETNNNSKNRRYQKGGMTKKFISYKRPTPKKNKTNISSSIVIGSGNSSNNNSVNNNSNNRKIVITKKDNSVNKSINSRNRYQKGGSTSSVNNSGNSNNRNTVNNNSNNIKIYKKKVDNSVNKSTNSRNTRNKKIGTFPYLFN